MQIQTHIINTLPVFSLQDSIKKVIDFFSTTTYSHIAVSGDDGFLGVLAEDDLEAFKECKTIIDYQYSLEAFFVNKSAAWFDVMEVFSRNEANLLPVINEDRKVIGYYDLSDIVSMFIGTPFFTESGSVIVVAKGAKDYSFSEISQIVEGNNIKLLGGFISDKRNDVVHITLKLGVDNVNEVMQTFRRYGYTIEFGSVDDPFLEDLKERSNYLEKIFKHLAVLKIAIYGQTYQEDTLVYVLSLLQELDKTDELAFEAEFYAFLGGEKELGKQALFTQEEGLNASFNMFVSFGGDGTILRSISFVKDLGVPIVGVNTGRLGFCLYF